MSFFIQSFNNDNVVSVSLQTSTQTKTDAVFNTDIIQSAINQIKNKGGIVNLIGKGTAAVCGTIVIPSNTTISINSGLRLSNYQNLIGGNLPMLVNENWQSPSVLASNGITDSATIPFLQGMRLATVDCGANAHGLSVGNGALIKNDTTEKYIGIWEVAQVLDAFKFTFYIPNSNPIGASAGPVTVQKADLNITINGGGVIDYRGFFNQSNYNYNAMSIIANKIRNFQVKDITILNTTKYAIYWGNLQDSSFEDIYIDGPSAAIQGIGFGITISLQRIKGQTNDDFCAWTGDNIGFPEFNFPNSNFSGPLRGLNVFDITSHRTNANIVGLYPTNGSNSLTNIVINGLQAITGPGRYVYIDGDSSVTTAGVGDVNIQNLFGASPKDSVVKVGGIIGGMTMRRLKVYDIDLGSDNITSALLTTGNNITISKIDFSPDYRPNYDSSLTQRYIVQLSNSSTFPDVYIEKIAITNAVGGSGTYLISGNFTGKSVVVKLCEFYGTSAVKTGNPNASIFVENCYFDSFRAIDITSNMSLFFTNNRFNAPSGPCILAYGNSFTAKIIAKNNNWGQSTAWLQIGVTGSDSLICEVWQSGNAAASGYGTGINFTSNSSGNYLRESDANLPMDAAKWTAIDTGCFFQNSNAAYGTGVGVYVKGNGASVQKLVS